MRQAAGIQLEDELVGICRAGKGARLTCTAISGLVRGMRKAAEAAKAEVLQVTGFLCIQMQLHDRDRPGADDSILPLPGVL